MEQRLLSHVFNLTLKAKFIPGPSRDFQDSQALPGPFQDLYKPCHPGKDNLIKQINWLQNIEIAQQIIYVKQVVLHICPQFTMHIISPCSRTYTLYATTPDPGSGGENAKKDTSLCTFHSPRDKYLSNGRIIM